MSFSDTERERYSRHLILPQVGESGQARLKSASVLCIGAGGLGSPTALYLAAGGVGRIGVIDADEVDLSNLQRQILHATPDLGRPKTASASATLSAINPEIEVVAHQFRLTAANVLEVFAEYDLIVDGSDNFPTRFLANDASHLLNKPLVAGAIFQFDGQLTVFDRSPGSPCYRCLLPEPPAAGAVPSCDEAGVLGALPGVIGCLQAMEVLKLILGQGDGLVGRMLHYDALAARFREIKLRRNPSCPLCGESPSITAPVDYAETCQLKGAAGSDLDVHELREILASGFTGVLLDVRQPEEHAAGHLDGCQLIPVRNLEAALPTLSSDDPYLVYCKVGQRSAYAVALMQQAGFRDVRNVTGGILAWHRAFGTERIH
jgi:molybdopterin/thiamine biosynthesis adenylyltransferase/rhodanese-related sulfurtransferase